MGILLIILPQMSCGGTVFMPVEMMSFSVLRDVEAAFFSKDNRWCFAKE